MFQSSPDPKAGCYIVSMPLVASICRFNPHPTRRPGATAPPGEQSRGILVSILTRPEGRVLPNCADSIMQPTIVSILTRPEGRVLP